MSGEDAMLLAEEEAEVLALRMVAMHLGGDTSDWLDWGDVPMLAESSYELLVQSVENIVAGLWRELGKLEVGFDIDSAYLLEKAEGPA